MKSLSTRMVTLIGALLFVICAVLAVISYHYSSNSVINEVNKSLIQLAKAGTMIVSAEINAQYNALEALAQDDTIRNPDIPLEKKIGLLRSEAERAGHISMGIADLQGNMTTTDGQRYALGKYAFFQEVLNGIPSVSDPVYNDDGTVVMILAVPVYQNGQVSGALVAVRDGTYLCEVM